MRTIETIRELIRVTVWLAKLVMKGTRAVARQLRRSDVTPPAAPMRKAA
jgi:hypothetical protein